MTLDVCRKNGRPNGAVFDRLDLNGCGGLDCGGGRVVLNQTDEQRREKKIIKRGKYKRQER